MLSRYEMRIMAHKIKLSLRYTIVIPIILLGVFHGLIYALVMPPWGLLDESQHFHYIQFIAEEHHLPVMWQDQLSKEVIDSFFETKRYITLGGEQMPDRDKVIVPGRLDSESYEAYQPPLYYLFLSIFYSWGPDDVLSKLFIFRFIGVLFSGVTLVVVWSSTRLLFPKYVWIAISATIFVALLPERAVSISRINNDVFLEVFCAISFYLLASVAKGGITWHKTLLVANILALAVLTKLSALIIVVIMIASWLWFGRRDFEQWRENFKHVFVMSIIISIPTIALFARNLMLYHDLTGMNAFLAQVGGNLVQGALSQRLVIGVLDLFRNSWVILWNGIQVVTKPSATMLLVLLAIPLVGITIALISAWFRRDELLSPIIGISAITLMVMAISVLLGYIKGFLPTVQGRFLLPALVPSAWLIGLGLWFTGKQLRGILAIVFFSTEVILGMSVLFFHSLPNYYAPRLGGFLGYWQQTVYLFSKLGLFWDKPELVNSPLVVGTIITFTITGVVVIYRGGKIYGFPFWFTKEYIQRTLMFMLEQRRKINPVVPLSETSVLKERLNWLPRLKLLIKNPLLWIGVGFFIIYLGWTSMYPPEIFWSLDEGGKFIHLKNIITTRSLMTSIDYPGRFLDPNLEFVPLYFWSQVNNEIYSWWANGFPMVTVPFYILFSSVGLYVLPAGFGALSIVFTGMIIQILVPQRRWLPLIGALITGLATPVAFYSTTFWEHTLSSGLFLGGVFVLLYAWKQQKVFFLFLSSVLLSFATYFRIDTGVLLAGILLALLVIRWQWATILGLGYLASSIPWWLFNYALTGNISSRRWFLHAVNSGSSWLPGVREAGWWFIPYTLFNAPKIGAFVIPKTILIVVTISMIVTIIFPILFKGKGWVFLSIAYSVIIAVSVWVLFQPEGYRSVHGFLLVAPHSIFATTYFLKRDHFRESPFPMIVLGMIITYTIVYIMKGWVAPGGLQWGPRYLVIFYPLVTIIAVIELANNDFFPIVRKIVILIFGVAVLTGFGFQIRGMLSALQTRQYYEETMVAINNLPTEIIATDCPWLSMVMPEIYFDKIIFTVKNGEKDRLMNLLRLKNISSFSYTKMDLCSLTPLNEIKDNRFGNPSGLTIDYIK